MQDPGSAYRPCTILDSRPPRMRDGLDFMPINFSCESAVDTFVEEDFHEALASMRGLASSRKAMT